MLPRNLFCFFFLCSKPTSQQLTVTEVTDLIACVNVIDPLNCSISLFNQLARVDYLFHELIEARLKTKGHRKRKPTHF